MVSGSLLIDCLWFRAIFDSFLVDTVPDGYLLVQAGQQLEYLTGGHVKAGYHEVLLTEAARQSALAAQQAGGLLWRISSTVFAHINSDNVLSPVGRFAEEAAAGEDFPPIKAGDQVAAELSKLFAANDSDGDIAAKL